MTNGQTLSRKRDLKLEALVNELIKENPNPTIVKKIMGELGISYCHDPFGQIDNVLKMVDKSLSAKLNFKNRPNRRIDQLEGEA